MGRKNVPAAVHFAKGNPSKLPVSALQKAVSVSVEIPPAPASLNTAGRAEWDRITVELAKYGLISQLDMVPLAIYCNAYGLWQQAAHRLKELDDKNLIEVTPSGYRQMSVWLQIQNRAAETIKQYISEFGLTPASRSGKVDINPQIDLFGNDGSSVDAKAKKTATYFTKH